VFRFPAFSMNWSKIQGYVFFSRFFGEPAGSKQKTHRAKQLRATQLSNASCSIFVTFFVIHWLVREIFSEDRFYDVLLPMLSSNVKFCCFFSGVFLSHNCVGCESLGGRIFLRHPCHRLDEARIFILKKVVRHLVRFKSMGCIASL